jgi:hypothetical protein
VAKHRDPHRDVLDQRYYKALSAALEAVGDEGLDVPAWTRAWVDRNAEDCDKVARALYIEAMLAKGRKHVKRPPGEAPYLPGMEHLGRLLPVAASVPMEGGPRYVALTHMRLDQADAAYEALMEGIGADMARATALRTLIVRRRSAGAKDADPLLPPAPKPAASEPEAVETLP